MVLIASATALIAAAYVWFQIFRHHRNHQDTIAKLSRSHHDLATSLEALGAAPRTMLPNFLKLILTDLDAQIAQLESAPDRSASFYAAATHEAENTRLYDRRSRFLAYQKAILDANVKIGTVVEIMKRDQSLISEFLEALNSGRLDPAMGSAELYVIDKAIKDLQLEAAGDLYDEVKSKRRKAESDYVLKFREAMLVAEQRIRDANAGPAVVKIAREP